MQREWQKRSRAPTLIPHDERAANYYSLAPTDRLTLSCRWGSLFANEKLPCVFWTLYEHHPWSLHQSKFDTVAAARAPVRVRAASAGAQATVGFESIQDRKSRNNVIGYRVFRFRRISVSLPSLAVNDPASMPQVLKTPVSFNFGSWMNFSFPIISPLG